MSMDLLPKCPDPEGTFAKLVDDETAVWTSVKTAYRQQLMHDVLQSLIKGLRNLGYVETADNLLGTAYLLVEETWDTFHSKITDPLSDFEFINQVEIYKFVRRISYNVIRNWLKSKSRDDGSYLSLDELADREDDIFALDRFLYQNASSLHDDQEEDYIRQEKIDVLIDILDDLNPTHQNILMWRVIDGLSSAEIVAKISWTSASVDTTMYRLRKRIADDLAIRSRKDKD